MHPIFFIVSLNKAVIIKEKTDNFQLAELGCRQPDERNDCLSEVVQE